MTQCAAASHLQRVYVCVAKGQDELVQRAIWSKSMCYRYYSHRVYCIDNLGILQSQWNVATDLRPRRSDSVSQWLEMAAGPRAIPAAHRISLSRFRHVCAVEVFGIKGYASKRLQTHVAVKTARRNIAMPPVNRIDRVRTSRLYAANNIHTSP